MANHTIRGHFVWHDLITPNRGGAHDFYSTAFGWKSEGGEGDASGSAFAAVSGQVGETLERKDVAPHWLAYVAVDDVDGAVERAIQHGATVQTQPTSSPDGARVATLFDPHGAAFGLHASSAGDEPESPAGYGQVTWHELVTNVDPREAFDWYAALTGWDKLAEHEMGPMGVYLIFGRNGVQLGGMFDQRKMGREGPAYWLGYVRVKDLDGTVTAVQGGRGLLLTGPMEVPGGDRIAQFRDPYGAMFAAYQAAADVVQQPAAAKTAAPARERAEPKRATTDTGRTAAKKARARGAKKSRRKPAKRSAAKASSKPARKKARKKAATKAGRSGAKKAKRAARAKPAAGKTAVKARAKKKAKRRR
jgi:predicted enzyme related to lactoylglutathione lyase